MRKNSRAYKIFAAGLEQLTFEDMTLAEARTQKHMLQAIAVMIAEATAKPKPKEKKKLLYNEQDVLKVLNFDLAITRHGALNGRLAKLELRDDDLARFEVWFRESMYPWMQSVEDFEFTYSMLTRKYGEWLEKARQYNGKVSADSTDAWR